MDSTEHSHDHSHDDFHDHTHHHHAIYQKNQASLTRALVITVIFMLVEVAGGIVANSLALLSDAAHMLIDAAALFLGLCMVWMAKRPVTRTMSFGYHRAEILGALVSGLLIWVLSGGLIYEAIRRIQSPPEVKGPVLFVIASIGLIANLLSMRVLMGAKEHSLNVRAAYLHVLADALGSVAAMIAGAVLILTGWSPIDPIVTILVSCFILFNSWELVKESVGVLMESTPKHVSPREVQESLEAIDVVKEVHDLHIWSVSTGRLALSVHLISEQTDTALNLAHRILREEFGIVHTTIQVEHPDRFQSKRCYDCTPT